MATPWSFLIQRQLRGCPSLAHACESPQIPASPGLSAGAAPRPAAWWQPRVAARSKPIYCPEESLCFQLFSLFFLSRPPPPLFFPVVSKTTGSVEVVATASPTGLGAGVTKATGSHAPAAPCHCAALPGDLVEEHRWGAPPAGAAGQLMDRLTSRLDGPEPELAERWEEGSALSRGGRGR